MTDVNTEEFLKAAAQTPAKRKMPKGVKLMFGAIGLFVVGYFVLNIEVPMDSNDYTNAVYRCDPAKIKDQMNSMWSRDKDHVQAIYLKDVRETARSKDLLECSVYAQATTGFYSRRYTFYWKNQDGHGLTGFRPER